MKHTSTIMDKKFSPTEPSTKQKIKRFGKWSSAKGWLIMSGYSFHKFIEHGGNKDLWIEEWRNNHGDKVVIAEGTHNDRKCVNMTMTRTPRIVVPRISKKARRKAELAKRNSHVA